MTFLLNTNKEVMFTIYARICKLSNTSIQFSVAYPSMDERKKDFIKRGLGADSLN